MAAIAHSGPKIGWIGLGNMGLAMAKNLQVYLKKSEAHSLQFWNRTQSRGEALVATGAAASSSIRDLVIESDLIFISLSTDEVVSSVVKDIILAHEDCNLAGKIVIDTSTVHPDTTAKLARELQQYDVSLVAAPVFGPTPVAQLGQLLIGIGGPSKAVEVVLPFLEGVLARKVLRVGEEASMATLLKTTGNFITAGLAETVSEAQVFAEKAGLPGDVLDAMILENYGPYAHSISQKLLTGAYAPPQGERPRSDLNLAVKDVRHGIEKAKEVGARLKIAEITLDHLTRAQNIAQSRPLDSSAVYGIVRQDAGLDFDNSFVKQRDG